MMEVYDCFEVVSIFMYFIVVKEYDAYWFVQNWCSYLLFLLPFISDHTHTLQYF